MSSNKIFLGEVRNGKGHYFKLYQMFDFESGNFEGVEFYFREPLQNSDQLIEESKVFLKEEVQQIIQILQEAIA